MHLLNLKSNRSKHTLDPNILNLFLLDPAGISLLVAESEHSQPQFCIRGYYHYLVDEGDQGKLCVHLLGQGGAVSAHLTLLDGTARGICDAYNYSGLKIPPFEPTGGLLEYCSLQKSGYLHTNTHQLLAQFPI